MARIYTRTGDGGETSLFDGTRVPKSSPRVDLYGSVDELNSTLGLALALLGAEVPGRDGAGKEGTGVANRDLDPDLLRGILLRIQADLLEIGSILANPQRSRDLAAPESGTLPFEVPILERDIDRLEEDLTPLKSFVLPGGTTAAAALHVARTVCRRAERLTVDLARGEAMPAAVLVYLNRLSDFCFVAARWANRLEGRDDVTWQARS